MQHNNFDSPDAIESELERDRANLASSLDELQDRMSFDSLARDAMDSLKSNAGVYTKSVDQAIRANPMAVALTGIGIAWLIFGNARKSSTSAKSPKLEPYNRWESEGGMAYDVEDAKTGMPGEGKVRHDEDWSQMADGLRAKASAAMRKIETTARDTMGAAKDFAAERAAVIGDFTAGLKDSMGHGLSDMSDAARERIMQARHMAYTARIKADGGRAAVRVVEDHPLIAGAVAMALGMVAATLVPRTQTEDRLMGTERDRMMREASRLFEEEKSRATGIAREVVDDLSTEAKGMASTVAALVSEEAKDMANTVADRVSDAAQDVAGSTSTPANQPTGYTA